MTGTNTYYHSDSEDLLLHHYDDASFCYQRSSGDTHLLNAFPAQILKILLDKPHNSEELGEITARLCKIDMTTDWQTSIEQTLQSLIRLELIVAMTE